MSKFMKKFDWQTYHRLIKPIILGVITVGTIWLAIWLVYYLNPTTTSRNAELINSVIN
jgi:hypothetical protein